MNKVRWGILSTAKIAREKVIPAMQQSMLCNIVAIASRDLQMAEKVAKQLSIPKAYGNYEALLNDPEVDAVYIPLPNNLHLEWAIKAIAADKHVLCEKPIGLDVEEAIQLRKAAVEKPHLKVMEAFMYRFHPQWLLVKNLVAEGRIGQVKVVQSFFSYFNDDLGNIRNQQDAGGGGLMDIGCYCISFARYLFNSEPSRVIGLVETDPRSQTDRLATAILQFSNGTSTFTCSTQLMPYQTVNIVGTDGRLEIDIPVNTPPDEPTKIWLVTKTGMEEFVINAADQYTLQGDAFSKAVLYNQPVPASLEDAVNNMKIIDAIFKSAEENNWINIS